MEPIECMNPNRYNYHKHKTMFKNKINCKMFYKLLELYNVDDESVKEELELYLYFTRAHYHK